MAIYVVCSAVLATSWQGIHGGARRLCGKGPQGWEKAESFCHVFVSFSREHTVDGTHGAPPKKSWLTQVLVIYTGTLSFLSWCEMDFAKIHVWDHRTGTPPSLVQDAPLEKICLLGGGVAAAMGTAPRRENSTLGLGLDRAP